MTRIGSCFRYYKEILLLKGLQCFLRNLKTGAIDLTNDTFMVLYKLQTDRFIFLGLKALGQRTINPFPDKSTQPV